jgi:hypothetical protein
MVEESAPDPHVLHIIQSTIATKAWYGLTDSGGFNWPASVGKMTEGLRSGLSWDKPDLFETVRQALETAFTPDCLTRVGGEPFVARLAALAHAHGNDLIVWTVGDVGWQKKKAENTGIFTLGVTRENFRCTSENKRAGLLDILQGIREHKPTEAALHTYVLDDKQESVRDIRSLTQEAAVLNVTLHDFHVKLDEHGAGPSDAYAYLTDKLAGSGDSVWIISDFDGVIANTDEALKERGARNIYNAYVHS